MSLFFGIPDNCIDQMNSGTVDNDITKASLNNREWLV